MQFAHLSLSVAFMCCFRISVSIIPTKTIWSQFSLVIANGKGEIICAASLVTMSSGVTSCECAVNLHFVFPEFMKIPDNTYKIRTRQSGGEGSQIRNVSTFIPHPKCTSNAEILGMFTYNFALAVTDLPFIEDGVIQPIQVPSFDNLVNFTFSASLRNSHSDSCAALIWKDAMPHSVRIMPESNNCEEQICSHVGCECPLNLEEKGILCTKTDGKEALKKEDNSHNSKFRHLTNCSDTLLTGSPVMCHGFLMGVVAPGHCKLGGAPVLISRIEPALDFIKIFTSGKYLYSRTKGLKPQVDFIQFTTVSMALLITIGAE